MRNIDPIDHKALAERVEVWLEEFAGDLICARQVWYEGLEGEGVPEAALVVALEDMIAALPDWKAVGEVRYEKYGMQYSFKREQTEARREDAREKVMVQHLFKVGGLYQAPDGKVYKIALSEVYNLRCFEVKDGHLTGPMVKIHPLSDLAKSLKEVG